MNVLYLSSSSSPSSSYYYLIIIIIIIIIMDFYIFNRQHETEQRRTGEEDGGKIPTTSPIRAKSTVPRDISFNPRESTASAATATKQRQIPTREGVMRFPFEPIPRELSIGQQIQENQ